MKGWGGSTTSRKRPGAVSGNQNSPAPIGTTRPAPSVTDRPEITLDGQGVTLSSAKTVAGAPVSASISVTRAPVTGVPVSLSKITPKGSTSTLMSAETSTVSLSGRIASMVMRESAVVLRRQSSRESVGGMRSVSITPAKMPLSGAVSKAVIVSRSPSVVVKTTVRVSIAAESRLAVAAVISKNSGSPPRSASVCWTLAVATAVVAGALGVRLAVALANSACTGPATEPHCGGR